MFRDKKPYYLKGVEKNLGKFYKRIAQAESILKEYELFDTKISDPDDRSYLPIFENPSHNDFWPIIIYRIFAGCKSWDKKSYDKSLPKIIKKIKHDKIKLPYIHTDPKNDSEKNLVYPTLESNNMRYNNYPYKFENETKYHTCKFEVIFLPDIKIIEDISSNKQRTYNTDYLPNSNHDEFLKLFEYFNK